MRLTRELIVPGGSVTPLTLDEVCFGECSLCIPPPESLVIFSVDMSNEIVSLEGVHLFDSFQGWDPAATAISDAGGGIFKLTLSLVEGVHHNYKSVNEITRDDVEYVPEVCGEDNGLGEYNRYVDVPVDDLVLDPVCLGRSTECLPPVEISFQVDMSIEEVSIEGAHMAGSFQGWDTESSPMPDVGEGIFTYTATLYIGDYHEYKFINGITWVDDETVPAGCAAGENRVLTVPDVYNHRTCMFQQ